MVRATVDDGEKRILVRMLRGTWAADPSIIRNASVNGIIHRQTLLDLGVASSTISGRCLPGGPWQSILPGVVFIYNGHMSGLQRCSAALAYGGDESMLTGHASLGNQGYGKSSTMNNIHLLIPAELRRSSSKFVVVERSRRLPTPIQIGNLRCAPLVRSVLDVTRSLDDRTRCIELITDVIQRGGASVEELAIELAEGRRPHSALTRKVLRELGQGAHSVAELQSHELYAKTGLPDIVHNSDVFDASGCFIARPDSWNDEVALAWEIDSLQHHLSTSAHEATMVRRSLMQRHGIIVVSHLPSQIRRHPAQVVADLRGAYALARSRPRPAVRLIPTPR